MVVVCVLGRWFDPVDVQVDGRFDHPQAGDSRLLDRLAQGHPCEVGISVGVATGLEPALQLGVEQDQDPAIRRIHDERRAREVTGPTGPIQDVGSGVQEVQDRIAFRAGRTSLHGRSRVADPTSGQVHQVGQVHSEGSRPGRPCPRQRVRVQPAIRFDWAANRSANRIR